MQMNNTLLALNGSAQRINGVQLSKDQTGVTAQFTITDQSISVFFDGYTAQVHTEGKTTLNYLLFFSDQMYLVRSWFLIFFFSSC